VVDATIIHAPSSTKNKEGKRDPEMHQTKKGNMYYFGMKAHVGVDVESGLVHAVVGTTANKVEHAFRVIKRQFGYTKVRFRGLAKNTAQQVTLFALSNLWMMRYQLLTMGEVRL